MLKKKGLYEIYSDNFYEILFEPVSFLPSIDTCVCVIHHNQMSTELLMSKLTKLPFHPLVHEIAQDFKIDLCFQCRIILG